MRSPSPNETLAGLGLAAGLLALELARAAVGPASDRLPAYRIGRKGIA